MKSIRFSLVLLLSAASFLASCGKSTSSCDGSSLNGVCYSVVNAGTLQRSAANVSGTGSLLFTDPVGDVTARKNFALTFSLEEGGSIDLVAFSDASLQKGATVRLKRLGSALKAGAPDHESEIPGVATNEKISTVSVDIHNDEGHLVVFSGAEAKLEVEPDEAASIAKGTGTRWGLVLKNATVSSVAVSKNKMEE